MHAHNGILFSLKNEGIMTHETMWMKLEGVKLSETSQSQKTDTVRIRSLEQSNSETGSGMVVARGWEKGMGSYC